MKDNKLESPFSPLLHKKVSGEAWRELNGSSIKIYIQLLIRARNSRAQYTYGQANKDCKMSPDTFNKAIKQLSALGFIDIISSGHYRKPNIYALSERWRQYNTEIFLSEVESRGNNKV